MRSATTRGFGPRARVVVGEARPPEPGPEDVLVEVRSSSVNPKDWKVNKPLSALVPFGRVHILGDDLAGVVVGVGRDATGFTVGDEVYGMDMRFRTAACAEYARIDHRRIGPKPRNLDFTQAAVVPLAALTCIQAFRIGGVRPGSRVLIIGASGGVGTFAVQIARAKGAHVTGVCSGRNVELVKSLGAEEVIDYTTEDYLHRDADFDMVFDVTSCESLSSCSSLMKEDGVFVSTGGNARSILGRVMARFRSGDQKSRLVLVRSSAADLEELRALIEAGDVTPVLDRVLALEDIDEGYERSRTGRSRGKIGLVIRA